MHENRLGIPQPVFLIIIEDDVACRRYDFGVVVNTKFLKNPSKLENLSTAIRQETFSKSLPSHNAIKAASGNHKFKDS